MQLLEEERYCLTGKFFLNIKNNATFASIYKNHTSLDI
jgi:hypothetical protein